MMVFGSSFVATKFALKIYDPIAVASIRVFIASLIFLILLKFYPKVNIRKQDWKYIILIGFFEPFLCFIFEGNALKYTSASQAGILNALLPLIIMITSCYFLAEKITKQRIIGMIIAFIGVVWLTLSSEISSSSPNPILGNILTAGGMVCCSIAVITIKHLTSQYSWVFLTAAQLFVGSIFFLPFLFFTPTYYTVPLEFNSVLAILYLGIMVSIFAYGLYNYGLSRLAASQVSIYVYLIPVFAMMFGYIFFSEKITIQSFMASAVVLLGVYLSQYGESTKQIKEAEFN